MLAVLLAACSSSGESPAATTPVESRATSTACSAALQEMDLLIVQRSSGGKGTVSTKVGECRNDSTSPQACVEAMTLAGQVVIADTTAGYNQAVQLYRDAAGLCRQRLS